MTDPFETVPQHVIDAFTEAREQARRDPLVRSAEQFGRDVRQGAQDHIDRLLVDAMDPFAQLVSGTSTITVIAPRGPERLDLLTTLLDRVRKSGRWHDRDIEILGQGRIRVGTSIVEFITPEEEAERRMVVA